MKTSVAIECSANRVSVVADFLYLERMFVSKMAGVSLVLVIIAAHYQDSNNLILFQGTSDRKDIPARDIVTGQTTEM